MFVHVCDTCKPCGKTGNIKYKNVLIPTGVFFKTDNF